MTRVIFYCITCEHRNTEELGMPGYILAQTEYDSLNEAIEHLNSTDHWIEARIEETDAK